MDQMFVAKYGKVTILYTTSDGQLAFGKLITDVANKNATTAIFATIPDDVKGMIGRKITTPYKKTIDGMCNPQFFSETWMKN